jgi:DNA-binding transcriptional LysR family regulator
MNDQIRELSVFLRVTEASSFSAAARSLDCNPSTVSKLIQRLENRLNVRLFNRTSRALRLTQEGERFLEAAQRVIEAIEDAENSVGRSAEDTVGSLRVNTSLSFAQYLIAPMLPEFLRQHPKLRVEMILSTTPLDMIEHQIDVSLRGGYIPDSSLIAKRITGSRWVICASPKYLEQAGAPRVIEDLAQHNCLNFPAGSYRSTWPMSRDGKTTQVEVKGNFVTASPELLRLMACDGLGIVRLNEFHVGNDLASGRLVALLRDFEPDVEEAVYAVYASKRNLSPRVKLFLEFLEHRLLARGLRSGHVPPTSGAARATQPLAGR